MKYEDLDQDTQSIIDAMCLKTGFSKEKSILILVEFGMLAMQAAVQTQKEEIMLKIHKTVNSNKNLVETANIYCDVWSV